MIESDKYNVPIKKTHPRMSQQAQLSYKKLLSYSNLKFDDEIKYRNVIIEQNEYIHQIYTINKNNLPHLVFLHGFGGTSIMGLRIFQYLWKDYQVHSLDLFGMGFSSRGKYSEDFDYKMTQEYFVDAIQKWRIATKINKFYLVGHSFGGYIGTLYANQYPERIVHLHLVSPAGGSQKINLEDRHDQKFTRKLFFFFAQKVYKWNVRPSKAMGMCIFGDKIVSHILKNRLGVPQQEQNQWREYLNNVNRQSKSSQTGFYKLFQWPLSPKITIPKIIKDQNFIFSIDFYYGNYDWMPRDDVTSLSEKQKKQKNIRIHQINKSGHQIIFDNPKQLANKIIQNSKKKNK